MSEPMKKTPTELMTFIVPRTLREDALSAMAAIGVFPEPDSIPFEEILPPAPPVLLLGARSRENLTQKQLSELTGIPRRHISEMENGKRPIGKKNARILADALGINPAFLLIS